MTDEWVTREMVEAAPTVPLSPLTEDESRAAADDRLIVASPSDPMAVARQFVDDGFRDQNGVALLRHHRGTFRRWSGTCWPESEGDAVRADLYRWLEGAHYWKATKNGSDLSPFSPTMPKVAHVVDALRAIAYLDATVSPPAWLDGRVDPPADAIVAMRNGLLDMRARKLVPHSPAFYSPHALPFDFDPNATAPARWLRFLRELWPDDDESIDTLQEVFGYVLSGDTRLQKLFLTVGPKRSGKGTIGRVLTGLVGIANIAAPTLSSLTTGFGLQPLVDRPLAVISDARIGTRVDSMTAVERLLSISGEDTLTIDRKYLPAWTGRLPTRFLVLTNEIPQFRDASGALASRFVMLVLNVSFYGREDPALTDALLGEAAGIFNWALDGLERLRDRGHFMQPRSAREALRQLEDLSSPMGAFVRDVCTIGHDQQVGKDDLYDAWKRWCEDEGYARAGTKATFFRDLRAAVPGVIANRPREGEGRRQVLLGIAISASEPGPVRGRSGVERLNHAPGQGGQGSIDPNETYRATNRNREEQTGGPLTALTTDDPGRGSEDRGRAPTDTARDDQDVDR
jgi:putative DNA primase/helicase